MHHSKATTRGSGSLSESDRLGSHTPLASSLHQINMLNPQVNAVDEPKHKISVAIQTTATGKEQNPTLVVASSRLAEKLVGDILIGCTVTFCVAPFLTVVDKAIVQRSAGSHTMLRSGWESIQFMARNPAEYLKSPTFLFMWAVYAATYSTANSLKTIAEHRTYAFDRDKEQQRRTSKVCDVRDPGTMGKAVIFLGTSFVNSGTALMKDRAYAKMFGSATPATTIPRMSYALWLTRDFMVIGSSFILPDLVSAHLEADRGMERKDAQRLAQIGLPVATQFIAGPLHYLGLDLYNRNLSHKSWRYAMFDRGCSLAKAFGSIVTARIARIVPGYSIGGVLNTQSRDSWRDMLIQREVATMMACKSQPQQNLPLVALLQGKRNA
jgi:hypothetical protein